MNIEKIRVGTALSLIGMFFVSIFTQFPTEASTRTILGTLALAAAGFLFGPSILGRANGDHKKEGH